MDWPQRIASAPGAAFRAVKSRLEKLGCQVTDEQLPSLFEAFKLLADKKKRVEDEDLKALFEQTLMKA
jgi:2-isopropylmalate synthase